METPRRSDTSPFIQSLLDSPPDAPLDEIYDACISREAELRRRWATDRGSLSGADPYLGLLHLFALVELRELTKTRPRHPLGDGDLRRKHVMMLPATARRPAGAPSIVDSLEEFEHNWSIFTERLLSQLLNWAHVVAAGGAVQACLARLRTLLHNDASKRHFYHNVQYPNSDIDLFLYGLTEEEALNKIVEIYNAVRQAVPVEVACVITPHTITIYSQFPYRPIQIVRRIYQSPAEILASFDIDSVACLYNGKEVLVSERWLVATITQVNTVDLSRRTPSYEYRLDKHAHRGYGVGIRFLDRDRVDLALYNRTISQAKGLARLLLLERAFEKEAQFPAEPGSGARTFEGGRNLRIPYGPGWTARRIKETRPDLNVGNRMVHEDLALGDKIERAQEEARRDIEFIRSRVTFLDIRDIHANALTPTDAAQIQSWCAGVYVNESRQFFSAIASHNLAIASKVVAYEGFDINQRDEEGRTGLHFAIIVKAEDIAMMLIDKGIQLSSLTPGGRNALHLAARLNLPSIVSHILQARITSAPSEGEQPQASDIDIESCDTESGLTPLGHAIFSDSRGSIEALWRAGARVDKIVFGPTTNLYPVNISQIRYHQPTQQAPSSSSSRSNERINVEDSAVVDTRRRKIYWFSRAI